MNWCGITPPTILSTNSNPAPCSVGSTSIVHTPYCPWPPDCFTYRPVAVALRLRRHRGRQERLRQLEPRQRHVVALRGERVAGGGVGELGHGADVARRDLALRLVLLALQREDLPDALLAVLRRVVHRRV